MVGVRVSLGVDVMVGVPVTVEVWVGVGLCVWVGEGVYVEVPVGEGRLVKLALGEGWKMVNAVFGPLHPAKKTAATRPTIRYLSFGKRCFKLNIRFKQLLFDIWSFFTVAISITPF